MKLPVSIKGYGGQHDEAGALIIDANGDIICSTASIKRNTPEAWAEYFTNIDLIVKSLNSPQNLQAQKEEKRMTDKTDKEVSDFLKSVFSDADNVKVTVDSDKVVASISKMYSTPSVDFKRLKRVSDYFKTDNVETTDDWNSRGCDSCDYGSSYGFELTITPE